MEIDNSRAFEEKYQEGYIERCNELVHANLILIESELYELTDKEREHFEELYSKGKGNDIEAKDLRSIALDYVTLNCKCINTITHAFNY
jgi:hypothetical protein